SLQIDSAPIVPYFQNNLRALVIRIQVQRAASRLACCNTLLRIFDPVINGVSHQVHQRLGERVQNTLVKVSVLSGHLESHVTSNLLSDIANHAGEAAE